MCGQVSQLEMLSGDDGALDTSWLPQPVNKEKESNASTKKYSCAWTKTPIKMSQIAAVSAPCSAR